MIHDWIQPDWSLPPGIQAVSTTRSGGFSRAPYATLNLADHVDDDPVAVARNRQQITRQLNLPSAPVWLQQVHGRRIVRAELAGTMTAADASYTSTRGVVCAVMTADCLPLLLVERNSNTIAAVHAGWRGAANGVIEAALDLIPHGAWSAWLGPAIGPDQFEVGDDVRDAMLARSPLMAQAFTPHGVHKWSADLTLIARIILQSRGVLDIHGGGWCTFSDARFYSYRRDGACGRMATLIWREK